MASNSGHFLQSLLGFRFTVMKLNLGLMIWLLIMIWDLKKMKNLERSLLKHTSFVPGLPLHFFFLLFFSLMGFACSVFFEMCIFAVEFYAYLINYFLGGFLLTQIGGLLCLHAKFEQLLLKDFLFSCWVTFLTLVKCCRDRDSVCCIGCLLIKRWRF